MKYKNYVVTKYFDKNVKATKRDSLASIVQIPDEYQEVEYLESTGTQYIDTGFKPNNNTKVDIKFMALDSNPSGAVPLFGTRSSNTKKSYTTFYKTSNIGSGRTDFGDQLGGTSVINFQPNTIYSYIKNKEKNYLNDINISNNDVYEFQTDYPLYLYDINSAGISYGTNNNRFFGNIYYTKIYDNDALVRNFVPVIRNDGKTGMLDLANLSNNLFTGDYSQFTSTGGSGTLYAYFGVEDDFVLSLKAKNDLTVPNGVYIGLTKNGGDATGGYRWAVSPKQVFKKDDVVTIKSTDGGYQYVSMYTPSESTLQTIIDNFEIMLNKGTEELPYEPYRGKSFYTNEGTGEFIAGPEI